MWINFIFCCCFSFLTDLFWRNVKIRPCFVVWDKLFLERLWFYLCIDVNETRNWNVLERQKTRLGVQNKFLDQMDWMGSLEVILIVPFPKSNKHVLPHVFFQWYRYQFYLINFVKPPTTEIYESFKLDMNLNRLWNH